MFICRACLVTGVDLYNIHEIGLAETFAVLIDVPKSLISLMYDVPPYICKQCAHLLHKFKRYRENCHKSMQILTKLHINNQFTTEHIMSLERQELLDLKSTFTETINIEPIKHELFISAVIHIDIFGDSDDVKLKNSITFTKIPNKSETSDVVIKNENTDPETVDEIANEDEDNEDFQNEEANIGLYYKHGDKDLNNEEIFFNANVGIQLDSEVSIAKEPASVTDAKIDRKRKNKNTTIIPTESNNRQPYVKLVRLNNLEEQAKVQKEEIDVVYKNNKVGTFDRTVTKLPLKSSLKGTKRNTNKAKTARIKKKQEEWMKNNEKNIMILKTFYESYPYKGISSQRSLEKSVMKKIKEQIQYLEDTAKKYNVDVKYLTKEEQKQELEDTKGQYEHLHFQCQMCYKGFSTKPAYTKHMAGHDPTKGDYKCDICHLVYTTNCNRSSHMKGQHSYLFTCKICGKTNKNISYVREHFACHSDGAAFTCDQCGKGFKNSGNYWDHVRMVHKKNAVSCTLCGGSFNGETGLWGHMRRMHKQVVECNSCKLYFEDKSALVNHFRNSTDGACASGMNWCTRCGAGFSTTAERTAHVKQHCVSEFKCDQCPKKFSNIRSLSGHVFTVHRKAKRPPKTALSDGNQKHMMTHTNERPYLCAHCPAAFRQPGTLKMHLRTHTLEKPFQCEHCQRRFSFKGNMQEHVRNVHQGIPRRHGKRKIK